MCGTLKDECKISYFCFSYRKWKKLSQPQCNIGNSTYICWRAFWACWHISWLTWSIYFELDRGTGLKWLIYLTNLSYVILTVQSIFHLFVVVCCKKKERLSSTSYTETRIMENVNTPCYVKVLWLLTSVAFDTAVSVSVLYWTLVFKELKYFLSIVTHAVNSFYVISDLCISATPVRLLHVIYAMIYGAVYIIFSVFYYLLHGTNSKSMPYIYKSLDWASPQSAANVSFGFLLIGLPSVHLMQFVLYKLRVWISKNAWCFNRSGPESLDGDFFDAPKWEMESQV